jgi:N4-gp56 family major capsid protein
VNVDDPTAGITLFGLCAQDITGRVTGWAGGRGYTDKTVIVSMANFTEGALESLSRELAFRLDRYIRTKISGNAFTQYAVSRAGVAPATNSVKPSALLFGKNVARLRPLMGANDVPTWDDGTYVGIAHELAAYDMFNDLSATGFTTTARYNDARMIYRGEVGEFYGIRWLLSNASVRRLYGGAASATNGLSGGVTGSNAYIFGPDGFYNLELETGGVEVIHQPLGSSGAVSDAAAQLGSIAVKVFFGVLPAPSADRRIMRFVHSTSLHY